VQGFVVHGDIIGYWVDEADTAQSRALARLERQIRT
jgi:hypothetical protein